MDDGAQQHPANAMIATPYGGVTNAVRTETEGVRTYHARTGVLTLIAGFVNIVAIEKFGVTCAHMTGNFTALGRIAGGRNLTLTIATGISVPMSFVLGGILLSLLKARGWKTSQLFRAALVCEAFFMAMALFTNEWAPCLLALALGTQNAYTSVIQKVRTTHVTGLLTDIGHDLGVLIMDLWRDGSWAKKDRRTFCMHASIPCLFTLGGAAAVFCSNKWGTAALTIPILAIGALFCSVDE